MSKGSPSLFERMGNFLIYCKVSLSDISKDPRKQSNKVPSKQKRNRKADERAALKAAKAEAKAAEVAAEAAKKAELAAQKAESAAMKAGKIAEKSAAEKRAKAADKAVTEGVTKAKATKPVKAVNAPEQPFDGDTAAEETRSTFMFTVDHAAEKLRDKPIVSEMDVISGEGLDFIQVMDELDALAASIGEASFEDASPVTPSQKSTFALATEEDTFSDAPEAKAEAPATSPKMLFAAGGSRAGKAKDIVQSTTDHSDSRVDLPEKRKQASDTREAQPDARIMEAAKAVSKTVSAEQEITNTTDKDKPYIYIPPADAAKKASARRAKADKHKAARAKTASDTAPVRSGKFGKVAAISLFSLLAIILAASVFVYLFGNPRSDIAAYTKMIDKLCDTGDDYYSFDAELQGDYFYAIAGSAATSMRTAVDDIIFLHGEGVSLSDVTAGRLSDWEQIERISANCSYPYYFQGLVYQLQGLYDSAAACYQLADKFSVGLGDNTDLTCMSALSLEELHTLRDRLTALEDRIYGKYTPNLQPRDMSDPLVAAQEALLADPFCSGNYYNCAVALLEAGNAANAADVVNLGLMQDSDDASLLNLCGAINYYFAKAQDTASPSDATADAPVDTAPAVSQSDVSGGDVSTADAVLPIAAIDYSRIDTLGAEEIIPVTLELGGMQFSGELSAKAALADGEINQAIGKVMQINGMSEGILSSLSAEVNKASVPDGATAEDCAAILALLPPEEDITSASDAAASSTDAEIVPTEASALAPSESDITVSQSDVISSADADASTALSPADALKARDEQEKDIIFIAKDKIVRAFSFDWFKLAASHKQYLLGKDNTDLEDAFEAKRTITEFYGKVNDELASMLKKSDKRTCAVGIENATASTEAQFYGCTLPETWTVNMSLVREGGAAPGIGGSYTGEFIAAVTYDASSFDAGFVEIFKKMNVFSSFWPGMAEVGMTIKDTTIQPTVITRTISCDAAVAMLQDNSSSALLSIEGGTDNKSAIINHNETISWNVGTGTVAWGIPVTASGAKLTFVNRAEPAIAAGYRGNIGEENKRYDIGWDDTIWQSIDITQPLSIEIG